MTFPVQVGPTVFGLVISIAGLAWLLSVMPGSRGVEETSKARFSLTERTPPEPAAAAGPEMPAVMIPTRRPGTPSRWTAPPGRSPCSSRVRTMPSAAVS